ncbi:MAG TPA: glucose-1-phosphate cytidylyltransferase [Actinomycetota bacterium]|nr:glucose-1-phosphate cytidylyltransferase [Actinomycetota bacterium]
MKVVILAGGQGTRLAEETETRPKPMVEIGGRPILWHIMKHYEHFGFCEFLVALGYRGESIKRYFLDCLSLSGSMSFKFPEGDVTRHGGEQESWTVHLVETGKDSGTGGRLRRLAPWLRGERFLLTYGDGVSNIDLTELVEFHKKHGKMVTVSAVRPPARFGAIEFDPGGPVRFTEKPQLGEGWINGGFMVIEPELLDAIDGDGASLETDVLEPLANKGEVMAFPHADFWHCMDTLRDVRYLRDLWDSGKAPWLSGPWD